MNIVSQLILSLNTLLWGDLFSFSIGSIQISLPLLALILIPTGLWFTWKTRFLPIRLLRPMLELTTEKKEEGDSISGLQSLIVSTATRVGMGNLVGVTAAVAAGGPGAVFWMWLMALLGASTAYIESTLAQLYKTDDPTYGGSQGGPAYYLHCLYTKTGERPLIALFFALSALLCFAGIAQVISNSVTTSFQAAFGWDPLITSALLTLLAALVIFTRRGTIKVLDRLVPVMAGLFFLCALVICLRNLSLLPSVFREIFFQAFGLQPLAAGGMGAVLANGIKRGLFSNEAGAGSAPCSAAAATTDHPAKVGLLQALGVLIDTLVICSCTAMILLLTPAELRSGLDGMNLLQTALGYHLGSFGEVFIALILFLFSFSTFIGILFYARSNVAYLFRNSATAQVIWKVFSLIMLFSGGIVSAQLVWELGDLGIGLMTILNLCALYPLSSCALLILKDWEKKKKLHQI